MEVTQHLHPSMVGRCCQTSRANAALVCVRRAGHSGSHHNYEQLWNDGEPIDIVPWNDDAMAIWADAHPEMASRWDSIERYLEPDEADARFTARQVAKVFRVPAHLISDEVRGGLRWVHAGIVVAVAIALAWLTMFVLVIHSLLT